MKLKTKELTTSALFIALVFVFTWVVKFQLPFNAQGGLIHLGNVPFFLACIFFGKKIGMLSGALGMTLFDLFSGWVAWAPITFICCLLMGYVIAALNERKNFKTMVLSFVLACLIKVLCYYIGECIIFSSFKVPLASIPGNIIQILISSIIVLVVYEPFKKISKRLI